MQQTGSIPVVDNDAARPQRSEHSNLDGYELFRRAIEDRDEVAWAEGAMRYRPMLISWAKQCSASTTISEHCQNIADYAFARAWAALSPKRFARFSTLAALLAYMHACVTSVVIDCVRNETNFDRLARTIETDVVATPQEIVLNRLDQSELWRIVHSMTHTQQERCVLIESYVYAFPPRAILERHTDLFADVAEIYSTKRNLLERLKHSPEMRQLYQERTTA